MVRAGELTTKATFERCTEPDDSFGLAQKKWEKTFDAMVKLTPASGGESVVGQQVTGINSYKVETHYNINVLPKDRFTIARNSSDPRYKAADPKTHRRIFGIESILNSDERNRSLELTCKELV